MLVLSLVPVVWGRDADNDSITAAGKGIFPRIPLNPLTGKAKSPPPAGIGSCVHVYPVFSGYSQPSQNQDKALLCGTASAIPKVLPFSVLARCGFYRWTKCVATGENLSRWLSPNRIPLSPGYQHVRLETGWSQPRPHLRAQSPQQLVPSTSLWGEQEGSQEWLSRAADQPEKSCAVSWQGLLIQLEEEVAEVWLDYRIEHCSLFSSNENTL